MANYHRSFFIEKMPKEFMKKGFVLLFVLLFSVSFVFAANGWGDINVEDGVEGGVDEGLDDGSAAVVPVVYDDEGSSGAETIYTQDFYIALWVAAVGIAIAALFIYLFLRRPKDKWKRKTVRNVSLVKK